MGAFLGQHFLRDDRVLDDILRAADLRTGQRVLEIGPGPGNLTERLARAAGREGIVVAIEADARLAHGLHGRWGNVEVVTGDAVRTNLATWGAFDRIVANLPYLISGPITAAFLDLLAEPRTKWGLAVLMYQREFALRLLAAPGTGDYGRLTVHCARRGRVTRVRDVPAAAFDPVPRVDSMVVRFEPHAGAPFPTGPDAMWRAVVDGTFQRRRKQLRNSLPVAVGGLGVSRESALDALEARDWLERRPENLSPAEFGELSVALAGAH